MDKVNDPTDIDEVAVRRQNLGEWLVEQIQHHELDLTGLAALVGVSPNLTEAWAAGSAPMTLDQAAAVDAALSLPIGATGAAGNYFGFQAVPELDGYGVADVRELDRGQDAVEALEAAITLGLGVRVRNQMVPTEVGDSWFEASEQWVVEILDGIPLTYDPLDVPAEA
jgi:hypothetical protein